MSNLIAWLLFLLGVAHIAYGLAKFKVPLSEVMAAGFVDQFKASELRRTAFWFVAFGPLLMLAGHAAIHAVAIGDLGLLKIIGGYALFISLVGVAAFPRSPFLASLIVSPLLIAAGFGWLA
ncbi:MAG: hypothetical protein H7Y33_17965 [Cytophagales bacterium]|nr:hypothetical protein [Rhizobacter sp.]